MFIRPIIIKGETRWEILEDRAAIIVSCWFAVAIISSVYMWIFGSQIADAFGVLIPVGLLVLVALVVTFGVPSSSEPQKIREAKPSSDLPDLRSKLDAITKEIEEIKKEIEK